MKPLFTCCKCQKRTTLGRCPGCGHRICMSCPPLPEHVSQHRPGRPKGSKDGTRVLSGRQMEVMTRHAAGMRMVELIEELGIRSSDAYKYRQTACAKLGIADPPTLQAMRAALSKLTAAVQHPQDLPLPSPAPAGIFSEVSP